MAGSKAFIFLFFMFLRALFRFNFVFRVQGSRTRYSEVGLRPSSVIIINHTHNTQQPISRVKGNSVLGAARGGFSVSGHSGFWVVVVPVHLFIGSVLAVAFCGGYIS